jgi:hypothetical protein
VSRADHGGGSNRVVRAYFPFGADVSPYNSAVTFFLIQRLVSRIFLKLRALWDACPSLTLEEPLESVKHGAHPPSPLTTIVVSVWRVSCDLTHRAVKQVPFCVTRSVGLWVRRLATKTTKMIVPRTPWLRPCQI